MDVGDKSRCLASGEKQQEEPQYLDWPDSQSAEVVDILRTGDAHGHREPGDERVVGEIPEEGKGGPENAKPALEQPKQPGLSANDGTYPLLKMRQKEAQMSQRGICHPRMTLTSQARLRRSKALLWSASVAAGMRARAGSSHPRQTALHGSAASPRMPCQISLGAAGGWCPRDSRCRKAVATLGRKSRPA